MMGLSAGVFRRRVAALPLLALLIFVFGGEVSGEVYLLGPLFRGGGVLPGGESEVLYTGGVEVNGVPGRLEVRRSSEEYDRLLGGFKASSTSGELSEAAGMFRFIRHDGGGGVTRLLVLRGAGRAPTVIFELRLPARPPANPEWPRELPEPPPGWRPLEVIRFGSGGVYGSCVGAMSSPRELLSVYSSRARSEGWISVGNEAAPSIGGNGDLFVRFSPRSVMWMSFSKSTVVFFRRDGESGGR